MKSLLWPLLNKTPVRYVGRAPTQFFTERNDATAQMQAFGSVGTLFAIVNGIAESIAAVDWRLYRKNEDQRRRYGPLEDNRVEVTRHLALDVWNKPNPFYTRQEFVQSVQQHLDLTGEGWWVISALQSLPLELWPVRPDRMKPVPHPTDFLSGYIYKGPDGEDVPLKLNEVVQLRNPNPRDPYRGIGPVQSLLVDLDSERYSAQWNRNFFMNSAEPGGLIKAPNRLSDDEFNELQMRWAEQHQGVARAHRVAILEGMEWVDRSFSMRDLQFAELRRVSQEIIRVAFRYPKPKLGSVDDVNRANAEAADYTYANDLLVPRLERWKGALNNDFLPLFGSTGQGVEFDYDNPVPEDKEFESADRTSRVNAAILLIKEGFDPSEVLEWAGLPDLTMMEKMAAPMPPMEEPMEPAANGNGHGDMTDKQLEELRGVLIDALRS